MLPIEPVVEGQSTAQCAEREEAIRVDLEWC